MSTVPDLRLSPGGVPATATQVRWLGLPGDNLLDEQNLHVWRNTIDADPSASLYLHPDVATRFCAHGLPLVYTATGASPDKLEALAVLAARPERIRLLPPLPGSMLLNGRRIVTNRLVGDASPAALATFVDALVELLASGQADFVLFQALDAQSPLRPALAQAAERSRHVDLHSLPLEPHWYIRFPKPPEEYWQKFTKKTRYNFRWRAKKLPHTVERFTAVEQVPDFLEKIHEVSRQAWQFQKLGLGIAPDADQRQLWEHAASIGAMRCYLIAHDGKPIAYATGIQQNGCFIYDRTGYDPVYAPLSPGNVLLTRVLEDLIERDTPETLDFGFGHAEYKEIFGNHRGESASVILIRRSLRPRLGFALQRFQQAAGRTSRETLRLLGVHALLRRMVRR